MAKWRLGSAGVCRSNSLNISPHTRWVVCPEGPGLGRPPAVQV